MNELGLHLTWPEQEHTPKGLVLNVARKGYTPIQLVLHQFRTDHLPVNLRWIRIHDFADGWGDESKPVRYHLNCKEVASVCKDHECAKHTSRVFDPAWSIAEISLTAAKPPL